MVKYMGNMYVGVSNKARKVKNLYIGISNKARKVSKGYIGVSNKARLFYEKEKTLTHGIAPDLSIDRESHSAAFIGNYALFAGGYSRGDTPYLSSVETYNISLTKSSASALATAKSGMTSLSFINYAIFGGGAGSTGNYGDIDAYDSSLTKKVVFLG